jgi:energy-coupling factor transporter ATP-binding protein EcfA2
VLEWLAGSLGRGMAAVWVTQDEDEMARADRVVVLGADDPPGAPPAPAVAPGAPALEVSVAADPGGTGPRVRATAPFGFTIGERGITALTGPNAAGKSVLLGCLAGIVETGQVRIARHGAPPAAPPILTLQYPELQVFEETVSDEVTFAAVARGTPRDRARAAAVASLEALGFDPVRWMSRRTWELSTGEKRIVETLGALIAPSGLVLLDEPTAGLDPRRRQALAARVALRAREAPVVVASQDRRWIAALGAVRVEVGETRAFR